MLPVRAAPSSTHRFLLPFLFSLLSVTVLSPSVMFDTGNEEKRGPWVLSSLVSGRHSLRRARHSSKWPPYSRGGVTRGQKGYGHREVTPMPGKEEPVAFSWMDAEGEGHAGPRPGKCKAEYKATARPGSAWKENGGGRGSGERWLQ